MTTENTAGRDIVALDARVVRATVSVVSLAGPADLSPRRHHALTGRRSRPGSR